MNHPSKASFFFLFILLWGCKADSSTVQESNPQKGEYYTATVHTPAGEQLEGYKSSTIPTFFNVGQIGSDSKLETIVLGERIQKNKKVDVIPIAMFEFQNDTIDQKYLVCLPTDLSENPIAQDFQAFMSYNNELTLAIENWFKLQCGLGHCGGLDWKFPHKGLLKHHIDNNLH